MATESEDDVSNTFIDDEYSMNTSYKVNKNHDKSLIKRPKPILKCVVCGDKAFGKINDLFFSYLVIFIYFRIQF
jgi:hypothetical protein